MKKNNLLRKAIISFTAGCCLLSCTTRKNGTTPGKPLDIYILMGQSNMAGRASLAKVDSIIKNKKVLMFNKELKWVYAKNPLHFDKPSVAGVGPGLSFGLVMQAANPANTVGLVPTAVGGTSINSWIPGGYDKNTKKHPYDEAERRIIEAIKTGTVRGVIWHQGEADSQVDSAKKYLPKLISLIQRIRVLTKNQNLPFVVGELGRFKSNSDNINVQLAKLPALIKNTAVVDSRGLDHKGDSLHFDAKSANLLGERFAEKMLQLQERK